MINDVTADHGNTGHALDRVAARVDSYGAYARPLREALALLVERPVTLREVVQHTHLPRRSVEELVADLEPDLVPNGARSPRGEQIRITAERVDAYRKRFDLDELARTALPDPLDARLAAHPALVTLLDDLAAAAPAARADLDHVPATARTAARRALWLAATYDLDGAHVLCVGDHDLTSLALAALLPTVTTTVVDVDEALLAFVAERGADLPGTVRCRYADLRFGLPPSVAGTADLVFTDPPYTPEGVGLFLARGLAGLRDSDHGRVLLAYGYSPRVPTLGWKVQRALGDLGLVVEAMLPSFHVYDGAEAVGSAADMYICQPTPATWKRLDRVTETNAAAIYTRGHQSLESTGARSGLDDELLHSLVAATRRSATAPGGSDREAGRLVFVGDAVPAGLAVPAALAAAPVGPGATAQLHVKLATVFDHGLPPAATSGAGQQRRVAVVADLLDDPGPWLLRLLLAVDAAGVAVAVRRDHPDLTAQGWASLTALVGAKWTATVEPDGGSGRDHGRPSTRVVAFTETDPPGAGSTSDPGTALVRWVLDRAHGKIGNVWREGLVRVRKTADGQRLSKREARAEVEAAVPDGDLDLLDARLADLPRHSLVAVLAAVRQTVVAPPG